MIALRPLYIVFAVLLGAAAPTSAALSHDESAAVLAEASEHFRKGAALLESDRDAATSELAKSIDAFERLIEEGRIRNGRLYYNIANAHLLSGDIGRAILNFKRAERLIPGDANLIANLAHARRRVANRIEAPAEERVRRVLLFWHDETPASTRYTVFLACNAIAWGWALLRLARPSIIGGWWPAAAFALAATAALASLLVERRTLASNSDGVIVADQTVGRKGPDTTAYEPSFTEPLHSGVEVTIVERRPGWLLARIADGRETWIEDAAIEATWPAGNAF
jgi:tetratricopeptide (TPR) repeat protein